MPWTLYKKSCGGTKPRNAPEQIGVTIRVTSATRADLRFNNKYVKDKAVIGKSRIRLYNDEDQQRIAFEHHDDPSCPYSFHFRGEGHKPNTRYVSIRMNKFPWLEKILPFRQTMLMVPRWDDVANMWYVEFVPAFHNTVKRHDNSCPKQTGIYQLLDDDDNVLYYGRAASEDGGLSKRFAAHKVEKDAWTKFVYAIVTGENADERIIQLETHYLNKHKLENGCYPPMNRVGGWRPNDRRVA